MTVKNLSSISFDEILDSFLLAFENYFVKMPSNRNYYKERWKAAKVNFNLSYGMFHKEKLVGFIIHAIDKRNGVLTAFNTGTGVIPKYRGQKIVRSIYAYALNDLKKNEIRNSSLEVITKNEIAIRSYQSVGFEIYKTYKCFSGTIELENNNQFELIETDQEKIDWKHLPNQEFYSWDNQKESIINGKYKFFQVLHNRIPESYFIINRESGYLAQFDLLNSEKNGWERLFTAIKQITDIIKINNVDVELEKKIHWLNKVGLENSVDQYEMKLKLRNGKKL